MSAKLRRTILENDQHIVVKNEKENWTLSRALHPNRLKSKGQDIVIEKNAQAVAPIMFRMRKAAVPIVDIV